MKKILVFLFVSVYSITNAQINSSFDIIGSLDYTYFHLTSENNDEITQNSKELTYNWYNSMINFRTGFNYNKRILNNFFIKTGINFVSIGTKTNTIRTITCGFQQYSNLSEDSYKQNINNYFYIEIPLVVRYAVSSKKSLKPFFEFGVSPNFFITEKRKTIEDNISSTTFYRESSSSNRIQYVTSISVGTNYDINEKQQIFAQATGRYHLNNKNKENKTSSISIHYYSIGLEMGTKIKIN